MKMGLKAGGYSDSLKSEERKLSFHLEYILGCLVLQMLCDYNSSYLECFSQLYNRHHNDINMLLYRFSVVILTALSCNKLHIPYTLILLHILEKICMHIVDIGM